MNGLDIISTPGQLLFDKRFVSPQVQAALPVGYHIRPLSSNDDDRGFLRVLSVLTEVGSHTKADFLNQFYYMKVRNDTYYTVVIVDNHDQIAATGTILVERKFVHKNGLVGHIEDIAVSENQQGKKLGLRIIDALKFIAQTRGCYKVILDCSVKNVPFYEKCGFSEKEHQMAWYVPGTKANL